MLKKILIILAAVAIFAGAGIFLYLATKPENTKSDNPGIGQILAPADSESRVVYDESKPVKLTYWRTWNEASKIQPIIDAFQKKHPNVTIEIRDFDYGSYDVELTKAAQTGNLPDIYSVLNDWQPRYVNYAAPAPDTVYTEKVFKDVFADAVTARLLRNGKIYGTTYGLSTLGLYYNPALLDEAGVKPPKNWDEFVEASRKLTKKTGPAITQSGAALGWGSGDIIHQAGDISALMMLQNGAQLTDEPPTKALFAEPDASGYPAGAKAMDFYTSFSRSSLQNYSYPSEFGYSVRAFAEGKVAMMLNYPFKAAEVRQFNPNLKFSFAAAPQVKDEKVINFATFWVEMVNKNSANSEIAWDFIRFAATRDQQPTYNKATLRPTSRKDLVKEQETSSDLGAFVKQNETATTFYRGNDKEMNGYFYNAVQSIYSGLDARLAVNNLQRQATDIIARYPQP